MERVTIRDREFTIEENESRGRTARVSISGSRIRMWFPRFISQREAERLYSDFREWALRRLSAIDFSELEAKPRHIGFRDCQELSVMGNRLVIRIEESGTNAKAKARIRGEELLLKLPAGLPPEAKAAATHNLVRKILTRIHLPTLEARMGSINSSYYDFACKGLALRDQSTRWGSCSRRSGRISLNFRLLFAPQSIMDYVIAHELSHLKEPNHSKRFWKLVASAVPDYKERRRWLNSYGKSLGTPIEQMEERGQAAQAQSLPASG